MNGRIAEKEPTWSERGLYYDSRPENERHLNVTIPVNDNLLKKNRTLYLHTQIKTKNPFYIKGVNDKEYENTGLKSSSEVDKPQARIWAKVQPEYIYFNQTLPVIKHMPKIKEKAVRNLLDDNPANLVKQEESKEEGD